MPEPLVQGSDDFRPVCLCTGPDGSLYFTDWVRRDFQLHRHGRVWRLRAKDRPINSGPHPSQVAKSDDLVRLESLLASRRLEVRRAAARRLTELGDGGRDLLIRTIEHHPGIRARLEAIWACAGAQMLGQVNLTKDTLLAKNFPQPWFRREVIRLATRDKSGPR